MSKRSAKKIRYAVVGLGNIAQGAVLPAFPHASENSELGALISGDPKKLEEAGREFGVDAIGDYDDLETILRAAEIDAVYLAVPNTEHEALAIRSMRAGAHVLCEKPMAVDERACRAMISTAKRLEKKLMIAYRLHFDEANLAAIEVATKGEIGEARIFSSVFSQEVRRGDIRTQGALGGGALYDMGIYCINAARYIFRAEPDEVFAFSSYGHDKRFRDVEEMTSATLRFPGGRLAQIIASQGASSVAEYRVVGTKGDLHVNPAFGYHKEHKHLITVDGKTQVKAFKKGDQFAPELIYFSRCIQKDLEPVPNGEGGLADVRVLCAIRESTETGAPVKIRHLPSLAHHRRPTTKLQMHKPPIGKPKLVHAPPPTR